jgi:hypothetical protein
MKVRSLISLWSLKSKWILCYGRRSVSLPGARLGPKTRTVSLSAIAGPRQSSYSGNRSPAGLISIFCCLRFGNSPYLKDQNPVFISPRKMGGPFIPPGQWVPFSSPLTVRRAVVELFEPANTWALEFLCIISYTIIRSLPHRKQCIFMIKATG